MKEYLLLRNNKQSGPYSVEDLRSMGLKPFDLVWIEKKSSAWRYPTEVKELAAFAPSIDDVNKVIVSDAAPKLVTTYTKADFTETVFSNTQVQQQTNDAIAERYTGHVVAIKPTINSTQVRTIKSNASRNIIQVKVRNIDSTADNTISSIETKEQFNNAYAISPEHNNILDSFTAKHQLQLVNEKAVIPFSKNQYVIDNKLEWMVLIIGAISLLAIVLLLVTSPY